MAVREIRGWSAATPLPHAPPHVLGMMNLRGAILPVIDHRQRLVGVLTQTDLLAAIYQRHAAAAARV